MQSRARQATTGITVDAVPASFFKVESNPWSQLQLYNLYRLVLAGALLLVGLTEHLLPDRFIIHPGLFNQVMAVFTVIVIIENIFAYMQWPRFTIQLYVNSTTDIVTLLAIMYASGGVSYGLGILLILPVITPNLFQPSQFSLLLTAITVILLISIEMSLQNKGENFQELSRTGFLALFMMLSSWLANSWSAQAYKTATLARKRGLDLASMSQLNQSILDHIQTGVIVLEDSRTIKHMNQSAMSILGQPKDWRNQPLIDFAPELDAWFRFWSDNHRPKVMSYDINHQGTTSLKARISQLGTRSNATSLIYLQNTHEEKEQLQDMKLASLGQLTASIAHEIRNPLGSISYAAQLMEEAGNLNEEDAHMNQIILSNAKRTDVIIDNVLNLSKRKNPKRINLRLKLWLDAFYKDFIAQNKLSEDQVSLFMDPENIEVTFDPDHLHQILWNLGRNAVKYAKEDPKDLMLQIQVSIPAHTSDVILSHIDNGKGISKPMQQRLFEPFSTSGKKGIGLGLFMSRELAQANGASLEYEKLASDGSCFRLGFANR
ncbi:MAG: Histidine kinase [uncultured Thiotrichaceae bacterium]|uniref:histidine kinase n=1 Tax=uncultured Thiotrichaceae bacterium TaxID=298394 RepID=A0A6S6TSS3_9GAMM|nr:MAG: Histidine kinase [uncultured Thiotrichaceae bacterium]